MLHTFKCEEIENKIFLFFSLFLVISGFAVDQKKKKCITNAAIVNPPIPCEAHSDGQALSL